MAHKQATKVFARLCYVCNWTVKGKRKKTLGKLLTHLETNATVAASISLLKRRLQ